VTARVVVNIDVPDLDRGLAFYRDGLGFAFRRRLFAGTVAELDAGGLDLYLIEAPAGSPAVPGTTIRRGYAAHWTPVHLDVVVDDLERAVAEARAAGATGGEAIRRTDYGRIAVLRDPFGHGLCLLCFEDGGYDRVAG